jgi:hypothetical protein
LPSLVGLIGLRHPLSCGTPYPSIYHLPRDPARVPLLSQMRRVEASCMKAEVCEERVEER